MISTKNNEKPTQQGNQNNTNNTIYIKTELFDHLIYPLSVKIDDNNIIQLFRKLHIMSSIDYKISKQEWIEQSTTNLQGFTEKEASILFQTYKTYAGEIEQKSTQNSRYDSKVNNDTVDVRYFALFFALQLFIQKSKVSLNIDNTRDKNPYSVNLNNYSSPLSSPRGKGSSSFRNQSSGMQLEYQLIVNFIKSNIKLFLRLIASDIHNTETSLNSNEFNTLKFFFKIPASDSNKNTLSSHAPFFAKFSSTTKNNIDIISEWLGNALAVNNISTSNNYSPNIENDDLITLRNLSKCVTIKDSTSGICGKNIKIIQCEDSYIYINSNVLTVKIANCTNCTVFVASVAKITSIDKCENCNICLATNFLRLSNTIDSIIHSYTSSEPIMFGDNRGVTLAPHNACYPELSTHLKNAKLNISSNCLFHFSNPINMFGMNDDRENAIFQILPPKDFSLMVVPFNKDTDNLNLILTPKEYIETINERKFLMNKIKSLIGQAKLQEEQEKALHVAIQGYFREWLVNSGNIKQMAEIVKMIDICNNNTNNANNNINNFNNENI